jgi:hypothetical protein
MEARPLAHIGPPPGSADSFDIIFEQINPIASVETDRYCDGCGYNLRLQPVRRDPRTRIPLTRCPECGMFHAAGETATAGKLWLYRVARILLLLWVTAGWCAAGMFVIVQAGISFSLAEYVAPTFQASDVRLTVIAAVVSLLLGLVASMICRVAFIHWKWWSFVLASFLWPTIAAFTVYFYMGSTTPMRDVTTLICIVGLALAQAVGGLIGVLVGRPLARAMIVALVPPSARHALDYLWEVDGKEVAAKGE